MEFPGSGDGGDLGTCWRFWFFDPKRTEYGHQHQQLRSGGMHQSRPIISFILTHSFGILISVVVCCVIGHGLRSKAYTPQSAAKNPRIYLKIN